MQKTKKNLGDSYLFSFNLIVCLLFENLELWLPFSEPAYQQKAFFFPCRLSDFSWVSLFSQRKFFFQTYAYRRSNILQKVNFEASIAKKVKLFFFLRNLANLSNNNRLLGWHHDASFNGYNFPTNHQLRQLLSLKYGLAKPLVYCSL